MKPSFIKKTIANETKTSLLLKGYWIIFWIFPCYFLSIFSASRPHATIVYILWPFISLSMIIARSFDIKYFNGKTISGKPITKRRFFIYVILASIPALVGEVLYIILK